MKKTNEMNKNCMIIILLIVILLVILLFKNKMQMNKNLEAFIVFMIIYLVLFLITNNWKYSLIGSIMIFLVIYLIMRKGYPKKSYENFENKEGDEPLNKQAKKAADNIQEVLHKMNGGLELKKEDTTETEPMGVSTSQFSSDKKPNALKEAQKETFELINTINTLKDTIDTLSPVLKEGKKLMDMFENIRI